MELNIKRESMQNTCNVMWWTEQGRTMDSAREGTTGVFLYIYRRNICWTELGVGKLGVLGERGVDRCRQTIFFLLSLHIYLPWGGRRGKFWPLICIITYTNVYCYPQRGERWSPSPPLGYAPVTECVSGAEYKSTYDEIRYCSPALQRAFKNCTGRKVLDWVCLQRTQHVYVSWRIYYKQMKPKV